VRRVVTRCRELGIGSLTLYAFSKENWSRPAGEIILLFGLLAEFLRRELPLLQKHNIRLCHFGDPEDLPLAARKALEHALRKTASNDGMRLNLALNYSGREEIIMACKAYAAAGGRLEDLTPELLSRRLYSAGQPDPDLIIRTSGECRTSNFLLFQSAYSEYYFTGTLWPDFDETRLREALQSYAERKRRFGNI
jgi:undecaprenyl diphosphate synthase